jgi:hypothetical protein
VRLQDKLQDFLSTVPRWVFLVSVPVVALIMATAVAVGFDIGGSGNEETPTVRERSTLSTASLDNIDLPPTLTPVPTEVGEVIDPNNRKDCDGIRGTDYKSPEERQWYLDNCARTEDTVQSSSGSSGGSGNTYIAAQEFFLGDRLIIPSIGVDATVTGAVVGSGGQMPDPVGYFNAVWYDFQNHPGIGGYRDGNYVVAAHVDCAVCHNGSSGTALFYGVSSLQAGATAQIVFNDGVVQNYVVRSVAAYSPGANWSSILATSQADLTLITCGGTWDAAAHEYSTRWTAYLDKV